MEPMTDPQKQAQQGQPDPQASAQTSAAAGATGVQGAAQISQLQAKIAELEAQLKKLGDMAGRAQADLQNAKVRLERDTDDLRKFATQGMILKLLPIIDNFQRAFQHLPEDLKNHEWVKGVGAIEQDFIKQLSVMGLQKIESLGAQVDTAKHEVITVGPGKEGEIIEVFEEGYALNGKPLRPAKVRVGAGSAA